MKDKTNINWYPGHMKKTKDDIKKLLPLVDIVYEVIDARMPLSSSISDLKSLIRNKPKLIIVTKYDLCDKSKTDEILNTHFKDEVIIKTNLLVERVEKEVLDNSKLLLKNSLLKREQKGLIERPIRALVVGVPNAGKSTLINNLVGKKATIVGNKPGVTKGLSWIRINKQLELLDTPGILWPKLQNQEQAYNLAAFTSIKETIVQDQNLAIFILEQLIKLYPNHLIKRYKLQPEDLNNLEELLLGIAKSRGALRNNEPDYNRIYSIIINDIKSGLIGSVTFD